MYKFENKVFCVKIINKSENMIFPWDYCERTEVIIRKMIVGTSEYIKSLLNGYGKGKIKEIFRKSLQARPYR